MPRFTVRLDEALLDRVVARAADLNISPSFFVREVLTREPGIDLPGYHARFDELHATAIQILSILAASIGRATPDALKQGMDDARDLLRDRGLLDPEEDR